MHCVMLTLVFIWMCCHKYSNCIDEEWNKRREPM